MTADPLAAREIVSARVFEAPRSRVYSAWTAPEQLERWWGPKGFTSSFQEFDLRPGGNWRFVLHGPDGADFSNHSVFLEITPPERIVFRHVSRPQFQVTATFAGRDEGVLTLLTFRMLFDTVEECARSKTLAAGANEASFDRLATLLAGG